MKKKINITVAKTYPKVHRRAGEATHFAAKICDGTKLHTIRSNYDLWAVNAEKMRTGKYVLCVRQWTGTPYQSKQREIFYTDEAIGVEHITMRYDSQSDKIVKAFIEDRELSADEIEQLARNDGTTPDEFCEWFFWKQRKAHHDGTFNGVIVHFSTLRYTPSKASSFDNDKEKPQG